MNTFDLGYTYQNPVAIALGFFDCIHKGHRALVQAAVDYANSHIGVESALFTFSNDPSALLGREKQIYDLSERAHALENLGLQTLVYTDFNDEFAAFEPIEFLNLLTEKLNIKAIITGEDYTFGKCAQGDVNMLKSYCNVKNIDVITLPFEKADGHKISTSDLKNLVKSGDITSLNAMLSEPYFMKGVVVPERHVGTKLGFPTANIHIADNKLPLAQGVYATVLCVDGKHYKSMTNVGTKPTFDIQTPSIEAYVLDFADDIYGKSVELSFISRMRDIKKFENVQELQTQLAYDKEQVKHIIKL